MSEAGGVRYARTTDGIDIAYTVSGEGDRDVVLVHGFTTHLDFIHESPWHARWAERVGERFRVIQLDKRGTGPSDRTLGHGSIEDRMRDVIVVMDAVVPSVSIVGISEGGPISLALSATYPERIDKLVLYGTFAWVLRALSYYPAGVAPEVAETFRSWVEETWGQGEVLLTFFVSHAPDADAAAEAMPRFERNACTRQIAGEIMSRNLEIDVRDLLPSILTPTLVMHMVDDPLVPVGVARHLAERIPGAVYQEFPGDFHCTWLPDEFEPVIERAMAFLTDETAVPPTDLRPAPVRSVATVLFTDIVGSTDRAASLGDQRWAQLLDQHNRRAVQATRRRGGTVVKTTGDGVLAVFDGPSRAIQAVRDLRKEITGLDLQLRAGIHTGEIERTGRDIAGIGVHIAARVMALAGPDEVVASRTVKELAAGSGIDFTERGTEVLRGVPGEWELYTVTL